MYGVEFVLWTGQAIAIEVLRFGIGEELSIPFHNYTLRLVFLRRPRKLSNDVLTPSVICVSATFPHRFVPAPDELSH